MTRDQTLGMFVGSPDWFERGRVKISNPPMAISACEMQRSVREQAVWAARISGIRFNQFRMRSYEELDRF